MGVETALLGLALAGGQMYMQRKQAKQAQKAAEQQQAAMAQQLETQREVLARRGQQNQEVATTARERAQQTSAAATGQGAKNPFILTSPLGVLGEPETAKKQLLGT